MLTLPSSVRIFIAADAVDLRRGFDGLSAATRSIILQDPLNGHVFAFLAVLRPLAAIPSS